MSKPKKKPKLSVILTELATEVLDRYYQHSASERRQMSGGITSYVRGQWQVIARSQPKLLPHKDKFTRIINALSEKRRKTND